MKLKPAKLFNLVVTLVIVSLAGWACFSLYWRYVENPWTRDGQVRANIVEIAPRVSGPIIRVAVRDNQQVKEGDVLFEIDPSDFQAQVDIAAGQVQILRRLSRSDSKICSGRPTSTEPMSTRCRIFKMPRIVLPLPMLSLRPPTLVSNWQSCISATSNRRRHLLKVFGKVAQIFQSFQQNGHALPIRIAAAASDKLQLGRSQQKMFGEFLVEVGILKSRILPVHRLPHFTRQFTPLGREGRIPCRAARLSLNFSHRL
jgi:Biotin-lipoyl like